MILKDYRLYIFNYHVQIKLYDYQLCNGGKSGERLSSLLCGTALLFCVHALPVILWHSPAILVGQHPSSLGRVHDQVLAQ